MGTRARQPGRLRGRPPVVGPGRWHIAIPAWGRRCLAVFERATLPALVAALQDLAPAIQSQPPPVLHMATDEPARARAMLAKLVDLDALVPTIELRAAWPPGPDGAFGSMSRFHATVLAQAGQFDRVLLLTADMVASREVLLTCERKLAAGAKLVCCVAPRALEDAGAPIGVLGQELAAWAWDNRHPMTRDCTWPDGRSYDVWRMYFERGCEVSARVFLPHPLALVVGGRRLRFAPTIDVNLARNFSFNEIYLITHPSDGAVVELSPADKEYLLTNTMRARFEEGSPSCPPFIKCTHPHHRMFFSSKVVLRGSGGDCGDSEVVARILGG